MRSLNHSASFRRTKCWSQSHRVTVLFPSACLFLLPACSNQALEEIAPPLSDSLMVQIIMELHLAEAKVELFKEDQIDFRDSIFSHYGVSKADYEANMAYYRERPDEYHKVYSEALDKMSNERFLSSDQ